MKFNERLIELRKKQGLSQEELGYKLNVTRQTVSKWELGQTTPEMDKLIEISKLFDVSVDELVKETEEEFKETESIGDEKINKTTSSWKPILIILGSLIVIAIIVWVIIIKSIGNFGKSIFDKSSSMINTVGDMAGSMINTVGDVQGNLINTAESMTENFNNTTITENATEQYNQMKENFEEQYEQTENTIEQNNQQQNNQEQNTIKQQVIEKQQEISDTMKNMAQDSGATEEQKQLMDKALEMQQQMLQQMQ